MINKILTILAGIAVVGAVVEVLSWFWRRVSAR